MKKRIIALALCFVMLLGCLGMSGDALTDTAPLYDRLIAAQTAEEFDAIAESATEDEIAALTDEQLNNIEQHYAEIYIPVIPKTVTFTDAGPFMPAVDVSSAPARLRAAAKAAGDRVDSDGVVTTKKVDVDDNGNYKLRLETYVTGKTTTTSTEKMLPVDIVLVLDQSGSMAYNFDGKASNYQNSRQKAMKDSVSSFIDAVAGKYSDEADHRISIVTFGSNASTYVGWTTVDTAGQTTLKNRISALPKEPSGATRVDYGMANAETLMGSGYNYNGSNNTRQKVVILFTDGVPTNDSAFDISVANEAITHALTLKSNGCTVYSIGIFTGANPNQLHGETYHYMEIFSTKTKPCNGSEGEIFNTGIEVHWISDVKNNDVPAGNRFLNFLSSNFKTASEIGLEVSNNTIFGIGYFGYKITKNFNRDASNYYLTGSNSNELNKIFQTISDNIQTGGASITLGTETVVKDVISDYFKLSEGTYASKIVVKTADCKTFNGDTPVWTNETDASFTPTIEGKTVSVTGFNFSENWVGKDTTTGEVHPGKKLIIEIPIEPEDGFLGGNNVPTNADTSGVYSVQDGEQKLVENYEVPTANVPIKLPELEAKDANVYYGGNVPDSSDLYKAYTIADKMGDFVNITYTLDKTVSNTADGTYTITATAEPKYDGYGAEGTPATAKTATATANVYVFKPEITYRDSAIDLGQTPNYNSDNFVKVEWKHGSDVAVSSKMIGTEPTLSYVYDPAADSADAFKTDTYVNVTVKIGNTDITNTAVTFKHEDCTYDGCAFDKDEGQFIVHIKTFDLTITKAGWNNIDKDQSFVFNIVCEDKNINMKVVIVGNDSVTIKGLPVGTYTITEDAGWSWRYELNAVNAAGSTGTCTETDNGCTYTPSGTNNSIVFTNSRIQQQWLSFVNNVKNVFQ